MTIKSFNWGPGLFLIIYQVLLLLTLPFYFYYATSGIAMIITSVILLYLTGLSITAGYHRLYSHRSYRAHPLVEGIILFFASMAGQGSALRWSFDHRLHHAYVDTDRDPYSIKKGFWFAHFLWMLEKPREIDPKVVSDLIKNPLVQFQHRYSSVLFFALNAGVCLLVGWLLDDYWGAFFLATGLRLFALHHFTWFINSLAHTWGDKPFCQEQSAVNNYIIALLTFGEGYHNFHHTFANDYRNGIRWYHFDPTKWLIWLLNKCGLADGLKRMDPALINKRLVLERKNLLVERLRSIWYIRCEDLENKIHEISNRLVAEISEFNRLREQYKILRRQKGQKSHLEEIKKEIQRLRKQLKEDWRLWVKLSRNILKLEPLEV